MKTRFVKTGNEFYEIDEECFLKKEKENQSGLTWKDQRGEICSDKSKNGASSMLTEKGMP